MNMSNRKLWAINFLRKYAYLCIGFYVSSHIVLYLGRDLLHAQPYYGYTLKDWLWWFFDYQVIPRLLIIGAVVYIIYYLSLRKMNSAQIFLWSLFAGAYISFFFWAGFDKYNAFSIAGSYDGMATSAVIFIYFIIFPGLIGHFISKVPIGKVSDEPVQSSPGATEI